MSAFVINRNYELQLPNSFVDVDRDEMEYVDGGFSRSTFWWGWAVNLFNDEIKSWSRRLNNESDALSFGGSLANIGISAMLRCLKFALGPVGGVAAVIELMSIGFGWNASRMAGKLDDAKDAGQCVTLCKDFGGYSVYTW